VIRCQNMPRLRPTHSIYGWFPKVSAAIQEVKASQPGTLERWYARGHLSQALAGAEHIIRNEPQSREKDLRDLLIPADLLYKEIRIDKEADAAFSAWARADQIAHFEKRQAEERERFYRELDAPPMYRIYG
jgi:hypothetical protein